jgi:hypothetical protein
MASPFSRLPTWSSHLFNRADNETKFPKWTRPGKVPDRPIGHWYQIAAPALFHPEKVAYNTLHLHGSMNKKIACAQ